MTNTLRISFPTSLRVGLLATALISVAAVSGASTVTGVLPAGWTGEGGFGTGTPEGSVGPVPGGFSQYTFVTTAGGVFDIGALDGVGGSGSPTNGSTVTTSTFSATAGDVLDFYFNYLTSDGAGFADYAWARVLDSAGSEAALLFTARTTSGGDTVPGFSMPDPDATLNPGETPIIPGAPIWSGLGGSSGACFSGSAGGCGYTGWINALYTLPEDGDYQLQFGVTNWNDTQFQSGLAIAGARVGGVVVNPDDSLAPIPLPAAGWLLLAGLGGLGLAGRRRKAAA